MKNIIVTVTVLLEDEMTEKEVETMFDKAILKETTSSKWTTRVKEAPNQTWD